MTLRCDCPFCGAPAATLYASSWGIESLECRGDAEAEALGHEPFRCRLDEFRQALAAHVVDRSAA